MTKEKALQAEEQIMNAVCDLCHWPFAYKERDQETMYAEKCENCPAAAAVVRALGLEDADE